MCYTRKYRKFSLRHNRNELDAYIIYQCRHYIKGDTARNNGPGRAQSDVASSYTHKFEAAAA